MKAAWICPICRNLLEPLGGSLRCVNGHSFDIAKEGHVNLMAGRQKSGLKGDTPDMLAARRRHFERGLYTLLRQKIIDRVALIPHNRVAETGCGEGYYIGGISEHISSSMCFGTDIAKDGIRLAAKRYPKVQFAVADTNRLVPLPERSADVLLDVFAPRNSTEFARVLAPGGRLLVAIPTLRHLAELRAVQPLLAIQADKRQAIQRAMADAFRLTSVDVLAVPLTLDGVAIADLVRMTPNAWFMTAEQKQSLGSIVMLNVTAEFELLEFQLV